MIFQHNDYTLLRGKNLYKKYKHDAGWDIRSPSSFRLYANTSKVINTGLHIFIPKGIKGIIQSRSGLSMKYKVEAGNAGVIDCGYTGECKIRLYNNSIKDYRFIIGDRIAQIVFDTSLTCSGFDLIKLYWNLFRKGIPQQIPEIPIEEWLKTDRGNSGIGSTGLN